MWATFAYTIWHRTGEELEDLYEDGCHEEDQLGQTTPSNIPEKNNLYNLMTENTDQEESLQAPDCDDNDWFDETLSWSAGYLY